MFITETQSDRAKKKWNQIRTLNRFCINSRSCSVSRFLYLSSPHTIDIRTVYVAFTAIHISVVSGNGKFVLLFNLHVTCNGANWKVKKVHRNRILWFCCCWRRRICIIVEHTWMLEHTHFTYLLPHTQQPEQYSSDIFSQIIQVLPLICDLYRMNHQLLNLTFFSFPPMRKVVWIALMNRHLCWQYRLLSDDISHFSSFPFFRILFLRFANTIRLPFWHR